MPIEAYQQDDEETKLKGFFRKAIPIMPRPLALFCCIMNILIPGLGTFISAFSVFCCGATHYYDTNLKSFLINILAFILQLCSAIILFGWIWSIKYGLLFLHLSGKTANKNVEADLPLFLRRHSSVITANNSHNAIDPAGLLNNSRLNKPRLSSLTLPKVTEEDSNH